jgi:integrase/recombinase XerD
VSVKPAAAHTFITNAARTISSVGGSLRDVQMLAGHRALSTTQRYIEADAEAQIVSQPVV